MFTASNLAAAPNSKSGISRRWLLGMLMLAAAPIRQPALANPAFATTVPETATETITQFNDTLLASMKAGERTGFNRRFQALAPAVDQAFDLPSVLSVSVGSSWASLLPEQQTRLLDAFRRYTVASYAANFANYTGQSFSVAPETRGLDTGRVLVKSRIISASGDATEMDYVMKQTESGWKIVDVLAAGSISRVAVQRSDFRHLLSIGGGDALLSSLERKASDLSGGALA
jgi:phospholipid transport system substrate-binding protein